MSIAARWSDPHSHPNGLLRIGQVICQGLKLELLAKPLLWLVWYFLPRCHLKDGCT